MRQTNYGNFSTTSSQNVSIGGPITSYKLYVRGSTSNDGIYAYTTKTNGRALMAYASNGYAGYFIGDTYLSAKVGIGVNPKNTELYEKLAISGGSFSTNGEGNGLSLQTTNSINPWGTRWYGLFKGNHSSLDLTTGSSTYHDPMILSSWYGLGFKTINGSMTLNANGSVTIGLDDIDIESLADVTNTALNYKLYVKKGIRTEKIKVDNHTNWPDYVFEDNYTLLSLQEVAQFVSINKHLPDVPSAETIDKEGIDLGEMNATLLRKIEELMLYTIQQQELLEQQQKILNEQQKAIKILQQTK